MRGPSAGRTCVPCCGLLENSVVHPTPCQHWQSGLKLWPDEIKGQGAEMSVEKNFKAVLDRANESIAVRMTVLFGSIWCVYVFFVFSLIPVLMPQWQNTLLYISNCIQLVALPALMVGNAVLSRGADRRASEDHQALLEILSDVREELADLKDRTAGLAQSASEALQRPELENVSISDQTFVDVEGQNGKTPD